MNLYEAVYALTAYGLGTGLVKEADETYIINRCLELFREDSFELSEEKKMNSKRIPGNCRRCCQDRGTKE